jgi:hypothetical protein
MTTPFFADKSDSISHSTAGNTEIRRERLRFTAFDFKRSPSAYCTADVELEWVDGERFHGRAEGIASPTGDLRLSSEATLRAIQLFAKGAITFELIGVKALRAFDANVVIVSVLARRSGGEQRLMGCHLADEDSLRSAVLATLQATNRILGTVIPES